MNEAAFMFRAGLTAGILLGSIISSIVLALFFP